LIAGAPSASAYRSCFRLADFVRPREGIEIIAGILADREALATI